MKATDIQVGKTYRFNDTDRGTGGTVRVTDIEHTGTYVIDVRGHWQHDHRQHIFGNEPGWGAFHKDEDVEEIDP